jgi:lipoprotein NlpD
LRLPRLLGAIGCCLILGGCSGTIGQTRDVYVVRPQDTLYSIAWRYNLDFHDLARWNNIGPDFRIVVGQTLVLTPANAPRTAVAAAPRASSTAKTNRTAKTNGAPKSNSAPANTGASGTASASNASGLSWVWPTDRLAAPQTVSGGGILIAGRVGQDVRAASSGRVVYNGNGIRGYGNLIIIKHGENLLSAYAHNRESLVHEGQDVGTGQLIAHMGEGAPGKPVLYFEIRRNGKPIDPVPFLPVAR